MLQILPQFIWMGGRQMRSGFVVPFFLNLDHALMFFRCQMVPIYEKGGMSRSGDDF